MPYSEHSSWNDLRACVKALRPAKLVPTVNASNAAAAAAIVDRFADLMDLSRHRGRMDRYLIKGKQQQEQQQQEEEQEKGEEQQQQEEEQQEEEEQQHVREKQQLQEEDNYWQQQQQSREQEQLHSEQQHEEQWRKQQELGLEETQQQQCQEQQECEKDQHQWWQQQLEQEGETQEQHQQQWLLVGLEGQENVREQKEAEQDVVGSTLGRCRALGWEEQQQDKRVQQQELHQSREICMSRRASTASTAASSAGAVGSKGTAVEQYDRMVQLGVPSVGRVVAAYGFKGGKSAQRHGLQVEEGLGSATTGHQQQQVRLSEQQEQLKLLRATSARVTTGDNVSDASDSSDQTAVAGVEVNLAEVDVVEQQQLWEALKQQQERQLRLKRSLELQKEAKKRQRNRKGFAVWN